MSLNNVISLLFRTIFFTMGVTNYFYFIYFTWLPIAERHNFAWIVIFIYHFLMIVMVWSLYATNAADPGQVPLYWGFYFGDSDVKRRRYCLMCNVFKPERCHHCSICNRCVLNMDHHCPWINNCIGFFNRKYFIQMLFYLVTILMFTILINSKFIFDILYSVAFNRVSIKNDLTHSLLTLFIYTADLVMMVVLILFMKFHIMLILQNKTTIETIDKKGMDFESTVRIF
jgi:hypothetical protein